MKVVIVVGSRSPEGQTATAAAAFAEGAREAGAEVETVFLPQLEVLRCRQCDERGWGICRTQGECVQEDDFAAVVDKVRGADAAAFATPVYWGSLSESMRALTDRLRRICTHEVGKAGITDKPTVGICVAGGGGGGGPSCTVDLERVLRTCGFDLVDLVPVRRQNLEFKRTVLRETGRWIARGLT